MAFVCENIDEETRSKLSDELSKYQHVMSLTRYKLVDHERDIVFFSLGGQGERPPQQDAPPSFYLLLWKGEPVAFEAHHNTTHFDTRSEAVIHIDVLRLSHLLEEELSEMQLAIKEALSQDWSLGYRRPVTVMVEFPRPTWSEGGGA